MKRATDLLLLLWLLLLPGMLLPGQTPRPMDTAIAPAIVRYDSSVVPAPHTSDELLKEYRNDDDFDYGRSREAPMSLWDRFLQWLQSQLDGLLNATSTGFWEVVGYLVLGATMVYVTMHFMGVEPQGLFRRSSTNLKAGITMQEDIHAMDFDALIAAAVNAGDYRWAIRLHYLRLLKQLTDRGMIGWKPEKTNHDYLHELKRTDLRGEFAAIITLFEYAWYGNFAVDRIAFDEAVELFVDIEEQIGAAS
jgi:hypothetical protein